jgi:hypothetical protein
VRRAFEAVFREQFSVDVNAQAIVLLGNLNTILRGDRRKRHNREKASNQPNLPEEHAEKVLSWGLRSTEFRTPRPELHYKRSYSGWVQPHEEQIRSTG